MHQCNNVYCGSTKAYWIDHKLVYFAFQLPYYISHFVSPCEYVIHWWEKHVCRVTCPVVFWANFRQTWPKKLKEIERKKEQKVYDFEGNISSFSEKKKKKKN